MNLDIKFKDLTNGLTFEKFVSTTNFVYLGNFMSVELLMRPHPENEINVVLT